MLEAMVAAQCAINQSAKPTKKICNKRKRKDTKKKVKDTFEINGCRRSLRLLINAYKKGMLKETIL